MGRRERQRSKADVLWLLKERQALPLQTKVEMTLRRVREWQDHYDGLVYLAYSGGKDSSVLGHIIRSAGLDIPLVFSDTGMEYPPLRKLAMRMADEVVRPRYGFRGVLKRHGWPVVSKQISKYISQLTLCSPDSFTYRKIMYGITKDGSKTEFRLPQRWKFLVDAPFKISHKCCDVLKKNPSKKYERDTGRKVIIATLATEGRSRARLYVARGGCNAFDQPRPASAPMSFWTEQDVLRYIVQHEIELPSVYGQIVRARGGNYYTTGLDRTGCMFCPLGVHNDDPPNKFHFLREHYPSVWKRVMFKMDGARVMDYVGVDWGLTVDERRVLRQRGGRYTWQGGELVWEDDDW